jgi:hypothetical protein
MCTVASEFSTRRKLSGSSQGGVVKPENFLTVS